MSLLIFALVFVFMEGNSLQKDTCKKTLEFSLSVLLTQKRSMENLSLDKEWKLFDSGNRNQLFKYIGENSYSECKDFPYLINGKDSDGSALNIFVRQVTHNDNIEVMIDK